jgi:uncharacterized protein DUF4349
MINEQIKRVLKIIGIVVGVLFLWVVFNLFTGTSDKVGVNNYPTAGLYESKSAADVMGSPMSVSQRNYAMDSGEMMMSERVDDISSDSVPSDKKVIKNGNLSLQVEKTEDAANEISQIAKNKGGELFSTNFYERVKGQKSGKITIKVPVAKFGETINKIKEVATQVISESTVGQDVTEQYTDLQAQLKNKKAEEESFVKILDRAGEIDDVLAVTKQISRVRGEIERLEGRIKYLESQTDMSTIVISLSEDVEITPISNDWRPWQVVKKSFGELINSIQGLVDGLIRFVIVTVPSLIVFTLVILVIWTITKKIYGKVVKTGLK